MDITRTDAKGALDDISAVAERARRRSLLKGADAAYFLWGVIWIIGFVVQQWYSAAIAFGPVAVPAASFIWSPLVILGIIVTFVIMKRRSIARETGNWRVGALWGLAFGYFYAHFILLWPVIDRQALNGEVGIRLLTASIVIVPMFVYVIMGLWGYGNYMIWLGLGVTVATVVGALAVPHYFYLWMAVFGGGALLATGVLARRRWAKA
jgi:hypothetical protein